MTKVLNGIEKFKTLIEIALLLATMLFFMYMLNTNVDIAVANQSGIIKTQQQITSTQKDILVALTNKDRDHKDFKEFIISNTEATTKMNETLAIVVFNLKELRKGK